MHKNVEDKPKMSVLGCQKIRISHCAYLLYDSSVIHLRQRLSGDKPALPENGAPG